MVLMNAFDNFQRNIKIGLLIFTNTCTKSMILNFNNCCILEHRVLLEWDKFQLHVLDDVPIVDQVFPTLVNTNILLRTNNYVKINEFSIHLSLYLNFLFKYGLCTFKTYFQRYEFTNLSKLMLEMIMLFF